MVRDHNEKLALFQELSGPFSTHFYLKGYSKKINVLVSTNELDLLGFNNCIPVYNYQDICVSKVREEMNSSGGKKLAIGGGSGSIVGKPVIIKSNGDRMVMCNNKNVLVTLNKVKPIQQNIKVVKLSTLQAKVSAESFSKIKSVVNSKSPKKDKLQIESRIEKIVPEISLGDNKVYNLHEENIHLNASKNFLTLREEGKYGNTIANFGIQFMSDSKVNSFKISGVTKCNRYPVFKDSYLIKKYAPKVTKMLRKDRSIVLRDAATVTNMKNSCEKACQTDFVETRKPCHDQTSQTNEDLSDSNLIEAQMAPEMSSREVFAHLNFDGMHQNKNLLPPVEFVGIPSNGLYAEELPKKRMKFDDSAQIPSFDDAYLPCDSVINKNICMGVSLDVPTIAANQNHVDNSLLQVLDSSLYLANEDLMYTQNELGISLDSNSLLNLNMDTTANMKRQYMQNLCKYYKNCDQPDCAGFM